MSEINTNELRSEDRVSISLKAIAGNNNCITRDISASGAYIESNGAFNTGELIELVIEFDCAGGKLILKCIAEVTRAEKLDGIVGLAVKISEAVMESSEGSIYMDSNIKVLSSSCRNSLN